MSKAELDVVLGSQGPFVSGEVIEGFVGMNVNRSCTCRGLTVVLEWFTHGRGNRKTGIVVQELLYEGPLDAGQRGLYPFAMTAPSGPFTYNGHTVSVGWRIRAIADLPWAFDPKSEAVVVLRPGTAALEAFETGNRSVIRERGSVGLVATLIGSVVASGVAVCFGSVFGLVFVGGFLSNPGVVSFLAACVAVVVPSVFLFIALNSFRKKAALWLGGRRLRDFSVHVPREVSPGQSVPVRVAFTPRRDLLVQAIRVRIECDETATSGSGTKRRSYTHESHRSSVVLVTPGTVPGKRPAVFSGTVQMPDTEAFSFATVDNAIRWRLVAVVDCAGPFDGEQAHSVVMQPANVSVGR